MLEYEDKQKKKKARLVLNEIFERQGVSGILAILVVGTACLIALAQTWRGLDVNLPKYFTELSTLIIGYYFGRAATRIK